MFYLFYIFLTWYVLHFTNLFKDTILTNCDLIFLSIILIILNFKKKLNTRLNFITAVYIFVLLFSPAISYINSVNRFLTLNVIYKNISFIFILIVLNSFFTDKRFHDIFIRTTFYVISILNIIFITKTLFKTSGYLSIFNINPNTFGDILSAGIFISLAVFKKDNVKLIKTAHFILIPFFLVGIYITRSLGATITLLITTITFYTFYNIIILKKRIFNKKTILIILFFIVVLIFATFRRSLKTTSDPYANKRIKIWHTVLKTSRDNILTGTGSGCFKRIASRYNFPIDYIARFGKSPVKPTNKLLKILSEEGIFSLILFLYFVTVLYKHFFSLIKRNNTQKKTIYRITFLSLITGILIHSLIDFPFDNFVISMLLIFTITLSTVKNKRTLFKINSLFLLTVTLLILIISSVNLTGHIISNTGIRIAGRNPDLAVDYLYTASSLIPENGMIYQRIAGILSKNFYNEQDELKRSALKTDILYNLEKSISLDRYNYIFYQNCGKITMDLFKGYEYYTNLTKYFFLNSAAAAPYNPENYYFLSKIYFREKNLKRTLYYIRLCEKIEPYYINIKIIKLKLLYQQKEYSQAKGVIQDIDKKSVILQEEIRRRHGNESKSTSIIRYLKILLDHNKKEYTELKNKIIS